MATEKFAVTTLVLDTSAARSTTIAIGRPQAIAQAERIGEIDERDWVREFLEGGPMRLQQLVLCSGGNRWRGVATINLIDE